MGERRGEEHTGFWWGNPREGDHLEDTDVDGDDIKMDLEVGWGVWTGLICLRIGTDGGSCECGNEPSGYINCLEFLD